MSKYDSIQLTYCKYTHTHSQFWPLAVTYDFLLWERRPITPVFVMSSIFSSVLYKIWCHHSAPCPLIWSREMWGHSSFPKCNINHNDFQKTKVQSKAVDQHLQTTWIRKIMSLPFWFNHSIGPILLQCDILITMISTSGTYVFVVLKTHGSNTELVKTIRTFTGKICTTCGRLKGFTQFTKKANILLQFRFYVSRVWQILQQTLWFIQSNKDIVSGKEQLIFLNILQFFIIDNKILFTCIRWWQKS